MSANSNLNAALDVLDGKLQSLQAMMRANQFMIDAMREQEQVLKRMDAEQARTLLRDAARSKFGEQDADSDVLAILDPILAPRQMADIIPFPGT